MQQYIQIGYLKEAYHKFTCVEWTSTIQKLLAENFLKKDHECIEIPQKYIDRLCKAGYLVKAYVQRLGVKLVEDKNAFLPKINVHKANESLQNTCNILFGKSDMFQLAVASANRLGREDLVDRALFLHSDYKVITHDEVYGTVIEIVKK